MFEFFPQVVGNELRIPQVDVKDRGVYVCEVNYGGENIVQVHSILEVMSKSSSYLSSTKE